ncbi:CheY chemotaxis protein or a CheY-like REC (receiver) domain [Algoriphagus locisalis]|uniref:CheY chemotaxis protein or a CheY-like REC (Receiver) domain n=1 Tax=Algoriphagus locisalis TaxID=305507 RepID=A0A1I6YXD8_9BACT|nr:response regulator [Algoriphagus locisalis]SFT55116.1 CheY chemotaxis protein or a CheY-like REC (receiver) domain [Algoriphagus locisalis]
MKIKVLLIDDDQVSLLITKKYLVGQGIHDLVDDLTLFTKAEEALNLLIEAKNTQEQAIFWILLDVNMPGMNGWDFLDEMGRNELNHLVKIVMLTSSISEVDRDKAKSYSSVFGYFTKPMSQEKCEKFNALVQEKDI